jgi:hypothetical protein
MGEIKLFHKSVQFVAAFSRYPAQLAWLWDRVSISWGGILLLSELFEFRESQYYESSMGLGLLKQFAILNSDYDPGRLAEDKIAANAWEKEACKEFSVHETRPLNIDPGYMTLTKLVLASTKNREHRIYLRDGVYAEVTLAFRDQQWQPMDWTYPDYQRDDFRRFFREARSYIQ